MPPRANPKMPKIDNFHIVYYDRSNECLKYAKKIDDDWDLGTTIIDSYLAHDLCLDSQNNPHIAYTIWPDMKVGHCWLDDNEWHFEVVDDLESGQPLSAAFAKHTDIFSPLYINLVRVGEESGDLDEAFLRLYQYLDSDKVTLNRIKTALFYPSMVLTAIVIAVAILMTFVIPKFAQIYERFKLDLPVPTKIIIAISHFFENYWWLILIVTVSVVVGLRNYIKTESGKLKWHQNKLKLPRIGDILLRATLARFARAFSMANIAGVPILNGLTITAKAVDNVYMEGKINSIRNDVERGETLTRAARSTHLFTPLVIQMLEIGEETGRLDEMMVEVAEFYEREVAYDVENISKIIEPIMTVAMGLIVLLLALGVFLPMWDLVQIAQR